MYIGLYLKKIKLPEKGHYPEEMPDKDIKKYSLKLNEALILGNFFLNNIDEYLESVIGPYDYDYFTVDQCKKLKFWIDNNSDLINKNDLSDIFKIIYEYCNKAIELDTGIEMEL